MKHPCVFAVHRGVALILALAGGLGAAPGWAGPVSSDPPVAEAEAAAKVAPAQDEPAREWLGRFDAAAGPTALRRLAREGAALGPQAPRLLLGGGFAARSVEERRAGAWLLVTAGDATCIEPALALLDDPDPEVRTSTLAFLSAPELRGALVAERSDALEQLAREAVDDVAVAGAVAALARIDHAATTDALARLMVTLGEPGRRLAARSLAGEPRARDLVVETVRDAFAREASHKLPDGVLAELMRSYGARLAELPGGGTARRDRVPFVLGMRHPSDDVRRMASIAVDQFVARAQTYGDVGRAQLVLRELVGVGVNDTELLSRIAALMLSESADQELALDAARTLRRATDPATGTIALRQGHADACTYEGAALLALMRLDEAEAAFADAEGTLQGLVADRLDLADSRRLTRFAGGVHERLAVLASYRLLMELAAGLEADHPRVLERAREVHRQSLEAHLVVLAGDMLTDAVDSVDAVLRHPLGPLSLVLRNPRGPIPSGRLIDLELGLCSAVATVAPGELPGFERFAPLEAKHTGPLRDKLRNALLARIQNAYYDRWSKQIERELEPFRNDPRHDILQQRYSIQLEQRRRRDAQDPSHSRLRLRTQGRLAIVVASHLRDEGRFTAARLLAERVVTDLEQTEETKPEGPFYDPYLRDMLEAQARLTAGNAWMDEGQPQRSEDVMLAALERFEIIEAAMVDQGESPASIAQARVWQADALVSLAVNANVKLRRPDRALEYFERAHALRSDDFMQVLLACYRARAGLDVEAREALRDTPVIPGNYYNLACTYALLGDAGTALDFLERDFDEKTGGSLERQKEWARDDPDLASLRGEPRFERLVRSDG